MNKRHAGDVPSALPLSALFITLGGTLRAITRTPE
jgi:hypothetical protein